MRNWRKNFEANSVKKISYSDIHFDIDFDWELIVPSFMQIYGFHPLRSEITYSEFCMLLSGLNGETPLGRVIRIRAETDFKTINKMTKSEKLIRGEWNFFKHNKYRELAKSNDVDSVKQLSSVFTGSKVEMTYVGHNIKG